MLDEANARRYRSEAPDLRAAAEIMALAVERCGEPDVAGSM
jgi:hypothetical protein